MPVLSLLSHITSAPAHALQPAMGKRACGDLDLYRLFKKAVCSASLTLLPAELLTVEPSSWSGVCLQAWTWVLPKKRPLQPSLKLLKQPSFWLRRSSQVRTCSPVERLAHLQWEHTTGTDAAGLAFFTHKIHTLLHDEKPARVASAGGEQHGGPQGSQAIAQAQDVAAPEPVEQEVKDDEMEQELAEAAKADPMAGRHLIDVCPSHQQQGACTLRALIASKAR